MKIIFFGTPDFAIPILKKLHESEHTICAVVTAPDKERGRGKNITFTPVKKFAVEKNIPVLQPDKLKENPEFVEQLKSYEADLFIVVAFRILPVEVFTLPPKGTFNLHGSLLPKYRGAAPIQWALIKGEKETGVTTFFLKEKVDTGNIILQEKITIDDEDDFESLHDKMSELGAEVVLKTVDLIGQGNVITEQQDDSLATPAPKITKEMCEINWLDSAENIRNLIRGLSPIPGAYFIKDGKRYKVFKVEIVKNSSLHQFEINESKDGLIIGCGTDALSILEIQPEGKKRMKIKEFLRGYSLTG